MSYEDEPSFEPDRKPTSADIEMDALELKARTERLKLAWAGTEAEQTATDRKQLRKRTRQWSDLALATLVDVMLTGDRSSAKVAAAKEILLRGYGQPKEDGGAQTPLLGVAISIDATREAARQLLSDPQARIALRKTMREKPQEEPME